MPYKINTLDCCNLDTSEYFFIKNDQISMKRLKILSDIMIKLANENHNFAKLFKDEVSELKELDKEEKDLISSVKEMFF